MPLYTYKCTACQKTFDRFLKLKDYDKEILCACGEKAAKQLSAPAVRGDYAGYKCPITDKWIEGRKAHQENLKRHGCRVLEPGESAAVVEMREKEDAELDAKVEETVDRFIAGLPAEKRDQLAGEVEGGMTATVVRQ